MIKSESATKVGCIHTSEGLDVDYVGVIIGPDLVIRNGEVITDSFKRAADDTSTYSKKQLMKENPSETKKRLDNIIKNTYRTLMSRGMKVVICIAPTRRPPRILSPFYRSKFEECC